VKVLQSLLLLIGALAVLALGTVGASASPAVATPCHETGQAIPDKAPEHAPKAMKAMICCVACVATPTLTSTPLPDLAPSLARLTTTLIDMPVGRLLSPEPGPPRLLIA
jgi:hypothetical protein